MKKFCLVLFLMFGLFSFVGCDVADDAVQVEESATDEVENSVEEPVDGVNVVDPEVSVPHMLGCPCCISA